MRASARGVSTITAILLITVLALLASAGIRMLRSTQNNATLDLQSQRAREAARAGIQTGFLRIAQTVPLCSNLNIANLPGTLAPLTVTLSCTATAYNDGGAITRYSLTATACSQPLAGACPNNPASADANYVEATARGECIAQGTQLRCW